MHVRVCVCIYVCVRARVFVNVAHVDRKEEWQHPRQVLYIYKILHLLGKYL